MASKSAVAEGTEDEGISIIKGVMEVGHYKRSLRDFIKIQNCFITLGHGYNTLGP